MWVHVRAATHVWALSIVVTLAASSCRDRASEGPARAEERTVRDLALGPELQAGTLQETGADLARLEPHAGAWLSADECERSWYERDPRQLEGRARVASWNIRLFPDTVDEPKSGARSGTDVSWLSCALAHLDAAVIAVQEIRRNPEADRRTFELVRALNERTGGRYRLELDRCDRSPSDTHVGFLFDEARVTFNELREIPLGPDGPCAEGGAQALAGVFRFRGGFDTEIVSVHLRAGVTAEAATVRKYAWSKLTDRAASDNDVIVLGDFNTVGCRSCEVLSDGPDEAAQLSERAAQSPLELRLVPRDLPCTQYVDGSPRAVDHLLLTRSTVELPGTNYVHVAGMCPLLRCRHFERDWTAYQAKLSDHCPIALEFVDRDLD